MDDDTLPRHLRVAMSNAQRAFERDDIGSLSTINEDIQGLVDAAVNWGKRGARMRPLRYDACIGDGCGDQDLADLDQRTGLCRACTREAARAADQS